HSSSAISFCVSGGGGVTIDGHRREFSRYDTWNIPALSTYWHDNETGEPQVRLTYSNAALLEKLGVHWVDPAPDPAAAADGDGDRVAPPNTSPEVRDIGGGAFLM